MGVFLQNEGDVKEEDIKVTLNVLDKDNEDLYKKLAKLPNLQHVSITKNENSITGEASLKGIEALQNIKVLEIFPDVKIDDFSPLYSLNNLEEIYIFNQRDLKEIDLTKFPNLRKISLSGCGVEKVFGLENIEPKAGQIFNFEACSKLKEVQGVEKFMTKMVDNKEVVRPILFLDDVFYNKVMEKEVDGKKVNEELEQKFIDETSKKFGGSSLQINTEFCDDCFKTNVNGRGTPMQMRVQGKYLDYILKKECNIKETDQDWVKAKKAYDWVTENFHYAYGMLELEDQRKAFGGIGYDHYNIGSAYFSLMPRYDLKPADNEMGFEYQKDIQGKFAVCEGIANVYIQMLQRMNIESHYTTIEINDVESKENGVPQDETSSYHGFVAAKMGEQYYYFDPTWDLGKMHYDHFGLNLSETKIRHEGPGHEVEFLNEEERFDGNESKLKQFEDGNFLCRGNNDIIILNNRTKKPGLIEYFGATKYAQNLLNTKLGQKARNNLQKLTNSFQKNVVGRGILDACDIVNYFAGIPVRVSHQLCDSVKNSISKTQNIFKRLYDFSKNTKENLTNFVENNFRHARTKSENTPKSENTDSPVPKR